MSHRTTAASIAVLLISIVAAGAAPAEAQDDPPRTAWGAPDLGGVWDFRSITPMQRPEALADQAFLTEEAAAELEQRALDRLNTFLSLPAQRTAAGTNVDRRPDGGNGSYNHTWLDQGLQAVGTRRTSLIVDPPNGRYPGMTAEGQERTAARAAHRRAQPADSWEDFSTYDRCILGFNAGPPMNPSAYNNNNMQLFQTPDHVAIMTEMVHTVRIVPLDGRPALDASFLQWSGDSRGRWEGDTLVIETANFDPRRQWRSTTGGMRLTERLTRVDADTLLYQATVDDPGDLGAPVDLRGADAAARGGHVGVCLPRGAPLDAPDAGRRPRARGGGRGGAAVARPGGRDGEVPLARNVYGASASGSGRDGSGATAGGEAVAPESGNAVRGR